MQFQLTRPMRGATSFAFLLFPLLDISTHAPHAGRDVRNMREDYVSIDFNSRAPCGARHQMKKTPFFIKKFQLTRPMRGATAADKGIGNIPRAFQLTRPMRGATRV